MSTEALRANLEAIFSRTYYQSEIFRCINEFGADVPIDISNEISQKLADSFFRKLDMHFGDAKLIYLDDCESEFRRECDLTIGFSSEVNERLYVIARNTLALIEEKRREIIGQPSFLTRSPIQINCEITTFLQLLDSIIQETASKEVSNYRIAQLVSDNFCDSDGKPIQRDYCKNKFSTSVGMSESTNNKVRRILNKSLERIGK